MRALILAAGRGTRISRYLSGRPKCTVDIGGGITLIENTIRQLRFRRKWFCSTYKSRKWR